MSVLFANLLNYPDFNMTKELIIITLILVLIYLYYQNKKLKGLPAEATTTQTIFEIGEDQEELIADKDEAIRKKNEAEQEALDLGNKLKLKQQEVSHKETEITRLKEEKDKVEISLNAKLKELKTSLSTKEKKTNDIIVGFTLFLEELDQYLDEEPFKKDKFSRASERVRNLIKELDNHD